MCLSRSPLMELYKVLGQSGYSLTCVVTVTGAENPSIAYQWTKNNGTHNQIQVGTDRVLSFSPLRVSDAGWYTCQATVSPCSITKMDTQDVILQSEFSYYTKAINTEGLIQSMHTED